MDDVVPVVQNELVVRNFETVNINICHLKLGHLSMDKHITLHKQYACIDDPQVNIPCDICSISRIKRLSFHVSFHKYESIFDLVHMDIWGPMRQISLHGDRYFLTIVLPPFLIIRRF